MLTDYRAYIDCQDRGSAAFAETDAWNRKAMLNIARMGKFSSDRTVMEYARDVWHIKPRKWR